MLKCQRRTQRLDTAFREDPPTHAALRPRSDSSKYEQPLTSSQPHPMVSQHNLQWYLNLPEKAWKIYFSVEERAALAHAQRKFFPEVADRHLVHTRTRTLSCSESGSTKSENKRKSFSTIKEALQLFTNPAQTFYHVTDCGTFFNDSCNGISATFEDLHNGKPRLRRPSFRRAMSLVTDETSSRRGRATSTSSITTPALPRLSRKSWAHHRKSSLTSGYDPQTPSQYYLDPEARMKLKMYLASPHKFEETLEYGFPSSPPPHPQPPATRHPSLETGSASNDVYTFLKNNTLSFLDDDDDTSKDTDEEEEEFCKVAQDRDTAHDDWRTPESTSLVATTDAEVFRSRSPLARPSPGLGWFSMDGTTPPQRKPHRRRFTDPSPQKWNGRREMTLRMTLTRPELREPEEQIYRMQSTPHSTRDDRLVLQALPAVAQNSSGLPTTFAIKQDMGKVRSFWRKIKQGDSGD